MPKPPQPDSRPRQSGFPESPAVSNPAASGGAGAAHRILELDGLRALAVLAVMSFHFSIGSPLANPVTGLGWVGVDLFFVLSGYLITGILLGARARPRYFTTFYARRTLRIFPIYYLLLGAYIVSSLIWGGRQPWLYWLMHAAFFSSVAEYFHYWAFAAPGFVYAGVTVLWSLSIEEMFYLMWAPAVRWVRDHQLWLLILAVVVGAPVLRFFIHTPAHHEYRFLPARFDSLAWGAALALGLRTARERRRAGARSAWRVLDHHRFWLALLAGSAVFLAALLAATGGGRGSLWMSTLGYSALALFFASVVGWTLAHAGSRHPACRILRWRPARHLGEISYTLYLVHYPIFMLIGTHLTSHMAAGVGQSALRAALTLGLAVLVAGASWRFFESPILGLKERWAPRPEMRFPVPVEMAPTSRAGAAVS